MKTCETCRFLAAPRGIERYYDDRDEETEHRTCARIIHGNGDAKYDDFPKLKTEPALVVDGSGYAARLIVLPTFGCALHEERVPPQATNTTNEAKEK